MELSEILKNIHIEKGDITTYQTGGIVNAANPSLLGGGGVDGAIHRAAGPALLDECKKFGGCNHGEAVITEGFNLKAKYVIHTPGPVYRGGNNNEKKVLSESYKNSLNLAKENNLESIAFPAISTGIYGYPREEASEVAIQTTIDFIKETGYNIEVFFVLFDDENYEIYKNNINNRI